MLRSFKIEFKKDLSHLSIEKKTLEFNFILLFINILTALVDIEGRGWECEDIRTLESDFAVDI